jgi:hypothetical protein
MEKTFKNSILVTEGLLSSIFTGIVLMFAPYQGSSFEDVTAAIAILGFFVLLTIFNLIMALYSKSKDEKVLFRTFLFCIVITLLFGPILFFLIGELFSSSLIV